MLFLLYNRLHTIRYATILPNFKTRILQTIYRCTINTRSNKLLYLLGLKHKLLKQLIP